MAEKNKTQKRKHFAFLCMASVRLRMMLMINFGIVISMADDSVVVHLKKGVAKNYVWF